jgi:hypothetical protein
VKNGTRLPSLQALIDPDDDRLLADLRLMATRRQIATFRSIADELERYLDGRSEDPRAKAAGAQLLEEMARLGCRALEAAAAVTTRTDESGVHHLPVRDGE